MTNRRDGVVVVEGVEKGHVAYYGASPESVNIDIM
jgi:hypothetical protein